MLPTSKPYGGTSRSLVLAFDIGTTYSGISYSILDPGRIPEIQGVMRFPGQESSPSNCKIPSILYYDRNGIVQAVGAQAMRPGIFETAYDEKWIKVEWFKFYMRPQIESTEDITGKIPPLPPNKSIVEVVADFLKYLYESAESYIKDASNSWDGGTSFWNSFEDRIVFVLSHPNGWEGAQQSHMRDASVRAGLIPDDAAGHTRISFVTEGEASLHFAVRNGFPKDALAKGEGILIVDAGGGTIDMSAYCQTNDSTSGFRHLEEIATPACYLNGSVFVSLRAHQYLRDYLAKSEFVDEIDEITRQFDQSTKLNFRGIHQSTHFVRFGSTFDNDTKYEIKHGQFKFSGAQIGEFFQPAVQCIIDAVQHQSRIAHKKFSHVILVGGFSANDWLRDEVKKELKLLGFTVMRPDNAVNKAVADGAVSFYLDHFVHSRISKVAYGRPYSITYRSWDPEHVKRKSQTYMAADGLESLRNAFTVILPKVSETKEFREGFAFMRRYASDFRHLRSPVWCYRGSDPNPKWMDVDPKMFSNLCSVEMDLYHLATKPKARKIGPTGVYYEVDVDVVLLFGATEFKAQLVWKEEGVEKRSEAKILYPVHDAPVVRLIPGM